MKKQIEKLKTKTHNFLRWSEKYTKTDMVYLAHGGFWLTLGQIVSSLSAFLLSLTFANLLPKEVFGTYKYVLSVVAILALPTLHGMGTAVTRTVSRGNEGSFIPALKTRIRWGLIGGLGSILLAGYYFLQSDTTLVISFLIAAVFLPIMDPFSMYDSILQGKKLFGVSSRYGIANQIVSLASMTGVLFLTKNVFIILATYFINWTLVRFIFLKITLKKFPINHIQEESTISYGKHLSIIGVFTTTAAYLDRLLVFHFVGAVELAIYSMAIAFPEHIRNFLKFIQPLALPKFANQTKDEIRKNIFQKMWKLAILIIFLIAMYVMAAPTIFKLLMPQYLESVFYSQIFSISLIYFVIALPLSALQAQMEQKKLYQFNIVTSMFQISVLILFAYLFGLMGIVIARVISRLFQVAFITYVMKKE